MTRAGSKRHKKTWSFVMESHFYSIITSRAYLSGHARPRRVSGWLAEIVGLNPSGSKNIFLL
jgi:hypothetical protein